MAHCEPMDLGEILPSGICAHRGLVEATRLRDSSHCSISSSWTAAETPEFAGQSSQCLLRTFATAADRLAAFELV